MLKIYLVIIRLKTQNPIQINHKVKKKKLNLSKIPIKVIYKNKINKLNLKVWQFKINKLMHKMFKKWLFKKKNPWKNKSQNKIRKNKRAKTITKMFNKR